MQLIKKNHASNKLAALVMILAMLVMSVSFVAPVQAGPGHIIEVSSGTGSPDQEVSLNITVAEKQGLAGVQYKVHYDKNQFSINTADLDGDGNGDGNGDGLVFNSTEPYFGWNQSTIYNDDGYVAIASASAAAFETSGSIDLVTIKFTVKPDAINGTYQITISEAKGTDGSPDPAFPLETSVNGFITITNGAPANIASVVDVTANVANGTSLADAKAALGTTVEVTLEGGGTATVPITWSEDSTPAYNATTAGDYVFTGNFGTLPNGITNDNNVAAPSGTVNVSGLALVYGDVNKDSVVDSWDALDILLYDSQLFNDVSAAATDIFANNPVIADINGDNSIDSWDALDILLYDSQLYDEISDAAKTKLGL